MDENQKLQLKKMISANNVEDQTELIRQLKHSEILRDQMNTLIFLKAKYRDDIEKMHLEAMNDCNFLFTYYSDIYNKIKKDEIDIGLFNKFLDVLKEIEDGKLDQHEGSFKVGTILKEIYVDSALKKGEKIDKENEKHEEKREVKKISWKQFKYL
jgi:hypothetical protein